MNKQLASLKEVYDVLSPEERVQLIRELEYNMRQFLFRAEEKKELIDYLKGDKE